MKKYFYILIAILIAFLTTGVLTINKTIENPATPLLIIGIILFIASSSIEKGIKKEPIKDELYDKIKNKSGNLAFRISFFIIAIIFGIQTQLKLDSGYAFLITIVLMRTSFCICFIHFNNEGINN